MNQKNSDFEKVLEIAKDSLVESNQSGFIGIYSDSILVGENFILSKEETLGSFKVICSHPECFYGILRNKWISAYPEKEITYTAFISTSVDICVYKKREENS